MKLCIADPPYLGRANRWYGASGDAKSWHKKRGQPYDKASGDEHPEAHIWDDAATHHAMVQRLLRDYDGWAVAMAADKLHDYMPMLPRATRIAVWHKPASVPGGSRLITSWEPVAVMVPHMRKQAVAGKCVRDVLKAHPAGGFVGAKPRAWTRWVLDMLGYDPDTDTVDDLFHGSGAVAAEIAQGVLL